LLLCVYREIPKCGDSRLNREIVFMLAHLWPFS
jgi:hypothetical protein